MSSADNGAQPLVAHMFWAYGNFSQLEQLAAASFIGNGYALKIWTYGDLANAPAAAQICDARAVLPESLVFLNRAGSYAGFSDYFRYAVLQQQGGLYADTDVIALRPASELGPEPNFLVTERRKARKVFRYMGFTNGTIVNGNVIRYSSPHPGSLVDLAYAYTQVFPKDKITWAEIGPTLLQGINNIHPRHGFKLMPPSFANPVNFWNCPATLLSPGKRVDLASSFFLHCYNEMWRRSGVDKTTPFPKNSLLARLASRYA